MSRLSDGTSQARTDAIDFIFSIFSSIFSLLLENKIALNATEGRVGIFGIDKNYGKICVGYRLCMLLHHVHAFGGDGAGDNENGK